MREILAFCCISLIALVSEAQYALTPLNKQQSALVRQHLHENNVRRQMAFAPVLMRSQALDSILDGDTKSWRRKSYDSWVMRKLRNEHLIEVNKEGFKLNGDAVFNLEGAFQTDEQGRRMYTNSRGFNFTGSIGERFFFGTSFYENQSILPAYMDSVVTSRGDFNNAQDPERGSIPGYGRWKPYNTSDSYDYDYTLGTGYVGLALSDRSFVQFGHDKQFLGYGYRSLFLSDASAPYPFLRVHFSFFKDLITYTSTWAVLQSLERVAPNYNNKEAMFRRLGARFSYLHFQPFHWAGIGLFDGTTWTWRDNSHPSSIEYYSPHAFFYTGSGIRNHLIGINGHLDPFKYLSFYGQWGINSGTSANALQLGMRWEGLPQNLSFTTEFNRVGVGFYYDGRGTTATVIPSEPFQAGTSVFDYYQHNDQGLGHPLAISMDEWLIKLRYRVRDFFIEGSYHHYQKTPLLVNGSTDYFQFEGGYVINPRSNAQVVLGNINRTERDGLTSAISTYTYIAFRTNSINRYLDF